MSSFQLDPEILAFELWEKVFRLLDHRSLLNVQRVNHFWRRVVVKSFIEKGTVKTDLHTINRPFALLGPSSSDQKLSNTFDVSEIDFGTYVKKDSFYFSVKKPMFLLGVCVHGPYLPGNQTAKDLCIDFKISDTQDPDHTLLSHSKFCSVKQPQILLPVFFSVPFHCDVHSEYELFVEFGLDWDALDESWPICMVEYPTPAEDEKSDMQFREKGHLCAYYQSGQVRSVYLWPDF